MFSRSRASARRAASPCSLGGARPSHERTLPRCASGLLVLLLRGHCRRLHPFSILRAGNLLRVPAWGSPPSAPPSSPSPVLLSSSGASGTSSPQARALSPLSIPHASLLSKVCTASPATLCTTASSPSSSGRRGFSGASVWEYALLVLILFHLFVVLYEEPVLESQFGESYRAYRRAVPRWGFTTRPFQGHREHRLTCRCS